MPALHDNKASNSPAFTVSSFSLFTQLPRELTDHILLLACRSRSWTLALDATTTQRLSLVLKYIYDLVNPLLYNAVRITRPSSLVEIVDTFEDRPELGQLVKHLHVGAEDTLVPGYWPLVMQESDEGTEMQNPILWLKTSLTVKDKGRMPKWCEPEQSWCLDGPEMMDCRGAAVQGAIQAALVMLDVEPYKKGYARSGGKIGLPEWAVRLFLLQACLDLYLLEMRRIEEAKGYAVLAQRRAEAISSQDSAICKAGECTHYPRFVLLQDGAHPEQAQGVEGSSALRIRIPHLWRHLTRRSAPLDQFNHPIRLASEVQAGHVNEYGRHLIMLGLEGPNRGYFEPERFDPDDDEGSSDEGLDGELDARRLSFLPDDRMPEWQETSGVMKDTQYTAVGLMGAASWILGQMPNLVNLSLNGYLHLAITMMDLDVMETLKFLSLGPLYPFWDGGVFSTEKSGLELRSLERLRISGMLVTRDEAERIAGAGKGLKKLRYFQYEMAETAQPTAMLGIPIEVIYNMICTLQGHQQNNIGSAPAPTARYCFMDISLHPAESQALYRFAPPHVRPHWLAGTPVLNSDGRGNAARHRVRLVQRNLHRITPTSQASLQLSWSSMRFWEMCGNAEGTATRK